jgi:hypothetical protein
MQRRGTVYIAPLTRYMPSERMVDPHAFAFSVSWQDWDDEAERGELIEDGGQVAGAEVAVAWGRERSDRVLIRLGHTDDSLFSAGLVDLIDRTDGSRRAFPVWPPGGPPPGGWWGPSDEAAAAAEAFARAAEPSQAEWIVLPTWTDRDDRKDPDATT